MSAQPVLDMGQPIQHGMDYPVPLTEKYRPRKIADFIGLEDGKRVFGNLIDRPRNTSLLLVGPPGTGKTTIAMAFASELPGALHHIPAQKCDVAAIDALSERLAYFPAKGKFHVVLIDEADQMTEKAQIQLLSRLDCAANLKPVFGGGFEMGQAPPVIWIFTCNGCGDDHTEAPIGLELRFLSRCGVIPFPKPRAADLEAFLKSVWAKEGGWESADIGPLAETSDGIRDALSKMELSLITGNLSVAVAVSPEPVRVPESTFAVRKTLKCNKCGRLVAARSNRMSNKPCVHECKENRQ